MLMEFLCPKAKAPLTPIAPEDFSPPATDEAASAWKNYWRVWFSVRVNGAVIGPGFYYGDKNWASKEKATGAAMRAMKLKPSTFAKLEYLGAFPTYMDPEEVCGGDLGPDVNWAEQA